VDAYDPGASRQSAWARSIHGFEPTHLSDGMPPGAADLAEVLP
jgi:hypothetical protein